MMSKPRVYHSFRSPYSRLGLHLLAKHSIDIELIPFTGPPKGVEFQDPVKNKAKLAYYGMDVSRMTMRMGLPIVRPNPFDVDFSLANRVLVAASRNGKALVFALAAADARWGEGKNVSEVSVLEECVEKIGWDKTQVTSAKDDTSISEEMRRHRELVEQDRIFGVPFAVYGDQKYWGHDRFDLLIEDIKTVSG